MCMNKQQAAILCWYDASEGAVTQGKTTKETRASPPRAHMAC